MIFVWMVPLPALVPSRIRSPRRCPARDIAAKANNEAAEIVLQEVWSRQTSLTNPSTLGIMFSTIGGNPSSLGSPGGFMFQLLNRLWMDEEGQGHRRIRRDAGRNSGDRDWHRQTGRHQLE
jgi:hypothetical protein